MKTIELKQPTSREEESYTEASFLDMLNESYGEVQICGMTMYQGDILKECDPIAFRCSMNDSQEYNTIYECPICGKDHDDEDDALYCCQSDDIYECEYCGSRYSLESECEDCENECQKE